jgi:hypothetical protein
MKSSFVTWIKDKKILDLDNDARPIFAARMLLGVSGSGCAFCASPDAGWHWMEMMGNWQAQSNALRWSAISHCFTLASIQSLSCSE